MGMLNEFLLLLLEAIVALFQDFGVIIHFAFHPSERRKFRTARNQVSVEVNHSVKNGMHVLQAIGDLDADPQSTNAEQRRGDNLRIPQAS